MTKISPPPNSCEAGFTLVEVLVVLAIMATVITLAVPAIRRQGGGVESQNELAVLEAQLREGRRSAVSRATAVDVRVPESVAYRPTVPPALAEPGTVRFYADGSSSGGALFFGGRHLLQIDWLSGSIERPRSEGR
jgi:prepilin-type N-terminal cleavage/methylation domain-containing protein